MENIVERIVFPSDDGEQLFVVATFSGRLQILRWPTGAILLEIESVYEIGGSRVALHARLGIVVAAGFGNGTVSGYSIRNGNLRWTLKLARVGSFLIE